MTQKTFTQKFSAAYGEGLGVILTSGLGPLSDYGNFYLSDYGNFYPNELWRQFSRQTQFFY